MSRPEACTMVIIQVPRKIRMPEQQYAADTAPTGSSQSTGGVPSIAGGGKEGHYYRLRLIDADDDHERSRDEKETDSPLRITLFGHGINTPIYPVSGSSLSKGVSGPG